MATQVQTRRGTTAQHSTFTGAAGELTVDTDKKVVVVHDGSTAGGAPLLRENGSQNAVTTGTSTAASFIPTSSTVPTNGLFAPSLGAVAISTNGSGRLFVDSSGRVGVGTASPGATLHVNSGATGTAAKLESSSTGSYLNFVNSSGNSVYAGATTTNFFVETNGSERLRITSAGLVGIGTTSPDQALTVQGKISLKASNGVTRALFGVPTWDDSYIALQNGSQVESYTKAAVYQDSQGRTNINSAAGQPLTLNINGLEAARIDSSSRLLVGTSSSRSGWFNNSSWGNPSLQVEGTSVFNSGISVTNNSNDDNGSQIILGKSRATSVGGVTAVSSGDSLGRISFQGADGTELIAGATIEAVVDAASGANDLPTRLVFSVTRDNQASPVEALRITNTGSHAIGSAGQALIAGTTVASGTSTAVIVAKYGTTIGNVAATGTDSFIVWSNGNVQNTNNSYTGISDVKLKENIVDAKSQWEDLKAFKVRNFNFKEGQTHKQIGLIAQEVEPISPGLVYESPDRDEDGNDLGTVTKSVNYSVLYMKAVKALQEAMERIEQLESEMASVKAKLP